MWQGFSAAARQAMDEGRQSHGKVLWLLADACSPMLSPKSMNEPFKPFMVMSGRRSVIPEDLAEADIVLRADRGCNRRFLVEGATGGSNEPRVMQ